MENQQHKEDLKRRTYRFSVAVVRLIEELAAKRIYHSLLDQLLRAGTSVGANIVEAKSSGTKKEFIRYYQIALKSSNETRYWLYLIRDGLSLENENLKSLIKENEEISKIIAKSILTLKTPKPENK